MGKRGIVITFFVFATIVVNIYLILGITGNVIKEDFELDSIFLKVLVKKGNSVEKQINIKSEEGGDFALVLGNIKGVSLSENNFILQPGENKRVTVTFNSDNLDEGIYVGNLEIISSRDSVNLPIIFEVESLDAFFDIRIEIPLQYSSTAPGEDIIAQLRLVDLANVGASKVNIEYYLVGFDGTIVVSETESVAISGNSLITKTISLPANIREGDYAILGVAKYKSSVGTSSYLITIKGNEISNKGVDIKVIFWGIFILAIVGAIVFVFVYLIREKNKEFEELRRLHSMESRMQRQVLAAQKKEIARKGVRVSKEIKEEIARKIGNLKKKQKARVKEFKELKDKGKYKKMNVLLNEWKKKGYNTLALEYKLKGLSIAEMRRLMRSYKTEGYKNI